MSEVSRETQLQSQLNALQSEHQKQAAYVAGLEVKAADRETELIKLRRKTLALGEENDALKTMMQAAGGAMSQIAHEMATAKVALKVFMRLAAEMAIGISAEMGVDPDVLHTAISMSLGGDDPTGYLQSQGLDVHEAASLFSNFTEGDFLKYGEDSADDEDDEDEDEILHIDSQGIEMMLPRFAAERLLAVLREKLEGEDE